jgi:hypothetical protein
MGLGSGSCGGIESHPTEPGLLQAKDAFAMTIRDWAQPFGRSDEPAAPLRSWGLGWDLGGALRSQLIHLFVHPHGLDRTHFAKVLKAIQD